jgi:hypothetical protein
MSFTYSLALVGAFSAVNSLDTEQFAPLKSNLTQEPFLWHDKTMALSHRSQFGMTCEPLTDDLGAALLIWWLEDSRVKTSAQLEKAQELTESEADFGANLPALLAKYDPITHSLKTAQCSLLEDLTGCLPTLPRWGTMQNGVVYQRVIVGLGMREIEFGFSPNGVDTFHIPNTTGLDGGSNSRKAMKKKALNFPTPTAHNAKENNSPSELVRNTPTLATHAGGKLNPNWVEWLMGWHIGQTDLKPLVTGKSHYVLQQH